MSKIITNVEELTKAALPLRFLTEAGPEKEEGTTIINSIKEAMEAKNIIKFFYNGNYKT